MKVNYLPKNKSKNKYLHKIAILVAVFIIGAVIFSFLDRVIISAFSPVWKTENVVVRNIQGGLAFLKSHQTLSEENVALKQKISSLELELFSLSNREIENADLAVLISRKTPNTVVATVLTYPPQTPYDIIIIDVGSNDFVEPGSDVILPEGPYLGTVLEVFPKKSRVKLLSSSGEETIAILERNMIPVTLTGAGGGNFKLEIPHDVDIERGDRILSADLASRVVATVGEIRVGPTDSFKEVLAKSPVNIFNLRFVFVAL